MTLLLLLFVAAISLAAVAYTHWTVRLYTVGGARVKFMRIVLAIVGVVLGYVSVLYVGDTLPALLVFLIGFGAVYVPAATILFLKGTNGFARRRSQQERPRAEPPCTTQR